jgi:hypothetical protein
MIDNVTPNYGARIAAGEVIINRMVRTESTRTIIGGDAQWATNYLVDAGKACERTGTYTNGCYVLKQLKFGECAHNPMLSISRTQLAALAGTQAAADVSAPDFDGATFVAELGELLRMLRRPLKAYSDVLKGIQRKMRTSKGSHGVTVSKFISANWLQYRYGIMPIVYDTEDVLEAIDNLNHHVLRYTARGSASDNESSTTEDTRTGYWRVTRTTSTSHSVTCRAGIIYTSDTRNSFGRNAADTPNAVWEVVPFSFVADWFANIGDFVGAITPKIGVNVLGSWTSYETLSTTSANSVADGSFFSLPSTYDDVNSPDLHEQLETRANDRAAGHVVSLATRPIPFKGDLGVKRIVDVLALASTILASAKR